MNILLIQPDIQRKTVSLEGLFPSLGLNLLATVLNKEAHSAYVFDSLMEALVNRVSGYSFFEAIKRIIIGKQIQVVGISTLLQTRFKAIEIAEFVKSLDDSIRVILGGPGASLLATQFLEHFGELFDVVVIGEGEETLLELIDGIEHGRDLAEIKGVAYPNPNNPKQILFSEPRKYVEDLDKIPFPDYSHYLKYLPKRKLKTVCLLLSRGCPYNCSFCGSRTMWRQVRYRSAGNVVEEIRHLYEKYGVENIRIHDDTFGVNRIQTRRVLEKIIESGIGLKLYAHSRIDVIDKEILNLFKHAGGKSIYYGIESGSTRIRRLMGKHFKNEEILEICKITKAFGIKLGVFLMFGYPTETKSNIKQTFELVKKIDPDDIYCSITKVQPGTQLYQLALDRKIISDDMWMKEDREYFTFLSKEEEEIIKGYEIIFYENFLKEPIRSTFEKNNDLLEIEDAKTYSYSKKKP